MMGGRRLILCFGRNKSSHLQNDRPLWAAMSDLRIEYERIVRPLEDRMICSIWRIVRILRMQMMCCKTR